MCNIVDFIPKGHANAVTRRMLCDITGLTDRKVRMMIHEARRETPIINLQDGMGYFQPTEDEVQIVEHYLNQEESRLKSDGWALKGTRDFIKEHRR